MSALREFVVQPKIFAIVLTSNDTNVLKCSEEAKDKSRYDVSTHYECATRKHYSNLVVDTRIDIAEWGRLVCHESLTTYQEHLI